MSPTYPCYAHLNHVEVNTRKICKIFNFSLQIHYSFQQHVYFLLYRLAADRLSFLKIVRKYIPGFFSASNQFFYKTGQNNSLIYPAELFNHENRCVVWKQINSKAYLLKRITTYSNFVTLGKIENIPEIMFRLNSPLTFSVFCKLIFCGKIKMDGQKRDG